MDASSEIAMKTLNPLEMSRWNPIDQRDQMSCDCVLKSLYH